MRVYYCLAWLLWLPYAGCFPNNNHEQKEAAMKNPLDSLWGTVISGLVLTLILYQIIKFALQ